jgi:trehalose/maltose hydrolase-like predicted phosphorylase
VVDGGGQHVTVRSCRIVSFEHRHLVAILYEVVVDEGALITIASQILNRQDGQLPPPGDQAGRRRARHVPDRRRVHAGAKAANYRITSGDSSL